MNRRESRGRDQGPQRQRRCRQAERPLAFEAMSSALRGPLRSSHPPVEGALASQGCPAPTGSRWPDGRVPGLGGVGLTIFLLAGRVSGSQAGPAVWRQPPARCCPGGATHTPSVSLSAGPQRFSRPGPRGPLSLVTLPHDTGRALFPARAFPLALPTSACCLQSARISYLSFFWPKCALLGEGRE